MTKLFTLAIAAIALMTSCTFKMEKKISTLVTLPVDISLTAEEKTARIFTPEIMLKMGRIGESSVSPDGKSVIYTVNYQDVKNNKSHAALWKMSTEGSNEYKILTDYSGKANSPQWNADGSKIYFMSNVSGSYQLWSIDPETRVKNQLSNIEGGIDGYGVSPKEDYIWYAKDVESVTKVKASDRYENYAKSGAMIYDDLMVRHWDKWENGTYKHIFVAPLSNGKVGEGKDILEGEPWDAPMAPYFDNAEIVWNNNGTALAYTCKKMEGKEYATSTNSDIYIYTLADNSTKNVTKGMIGYDKYPKFSPDDSMIAWQSMERAGNESDKDRLFIQNLATGDKTYVTKKFDYNAENLTWSEDGKRIFFIAPIEATHQICCADIAENSIKMLTEGLHDYTGFSKAGEVVIVEKTTLSMATELFNVNLKDGTDKQMSFVNKEIYENVDMGEVEKRMVTTTDGKEMLTWVIKPPKFDSSKKYPALLYCQGGPQSVVSQRWSYRWNFQLMAAQGYVVVAPNRRGLPSFGQEWLDQISGDYPGQNQRDYMSAIDDVSKESYVDRERLGCVGASYGGFSVYYIAGTHEKRFKALISHCGMFDLPSFYGSTEELWFPNNDLGGAYWEKDNATAQRTYANSPHTMVNKWDTPILIIVGMKDYRIPYTQSLEAFTAAKLHNVPARLVAFEDEAHQVFKPQNALVWHSEFFGWLDKYLKK